MSEAEGINVPESLEAADQDLVLSSSGELSGELEGADMAISDPGALPDYVISPDDIPEPESENIAVTSSTIIVRFDTQVFWILVEPGSDVESAADTLAEITQAVQEAS
ncbi:MAG: hypothetical protein L0G71_07455 [Yaniella sp.]|nr:hypothetical protein [Yaniella sp.]